MLIFYISMIRYGMIFLCYGMLFLCYAMRYLNMIWYDMVCYGLVRYGMVCVQSLLMKVCNLWPVLSAHVRFSECAQHPKDNTRRPLINQHLLPSVCQWTWHYLQWRIRGGGRGPCWLGRILRSGVCFDTSSHKPYVFVVRVVNKIHIVNIVFWMKSKYMRVSP